MPLVRGSAIPAGGLGEVLRHPLVLVFFVHATEFDLGAGVPLVGSSAIPVGGFGIVLWQPLAFIEHAAELVLCLDVPFLCKPTDFR